MPLIIEDGTMPEGANSYASVEEADAYWSMRSMGDEQAWPTAPQQPGPPLDESQPQPVPDPNMGEKEASLVRASDYLNGLQWYGEKICWDWLMAWPRDGEGLPDMKIRVPVVPDSPEGDNTPVFAAEPPYIERYIVPIAVKRACIELAAIFIGGDDPLAPVERGGRVASETVGPISMSYFEDAADGTLYPAIAGLIGPFLRVIPGISEGSGITVFRVGAA